jgi:guanylate kinase
MSKLKEILKESSMALTMSDFEIDEIAEEIRTDFDDYLEEERERIKEELEDTDKIGSLEKTISRLESTIEDLKTKVLPINTLNDEMTLEWAKENWEHLIKLQQMNASGSGVVKLVQGWLEKALETILLDELKAVGNHTRIVLVGKAASGKDHARKLLEERGNRYAVSFTTRPPRTGEVNGKDYFFITDEEFDKMIKEDKFYEYVSFNGWHYGTSNEQFYSDNVFIMTPHGISKIDPADRKKTFIVYFDIEEDIRRERLALRSDADTVDRRLIADTKDFENFTDFDIRITNSDF